MRNLKANNRKLWYALYQEHTNGVDENGDYTGEPEITYSDPVMFEANLSATRGTQGFTGTGASNDYFGSDVDYALIISTADMTLPINENSLIWTTKPETDLATGKVDFTKAKFAVTALAKGLYHMKYAIRRLPASEGD